MSIEHRWGERVAVNQTVGLRSQDGAITVAQLVNISSTGAFVITRAAYFDLTFVQVLISGVALAALIVRHAANGVGLEWREQLPERINALLISARRVGVANGPDI